MEVIAYKGMHSDMTCRGFQYEIGKTYKKEFETTDRGFYASLNPRSIFTYYPKKDNSRYFKVKLSGFIHKPFPFDDSIEAIQITILEEITDNIDGIIKNVEWWKNEGVLDCLTFTEGFCPIQRYNDLWNFIDKNGNLLSIDWFYQILSSFKDGTAVVRTISPCTGYNIIDSNGNLILEEDYQYIDIFRNDIAVVKNDDFYNFINRQGKLLSEDWFEYAGDFSNNIAFVVNKDFLHNYIDIKGNYLSVEWFKTCCDFQEDGFAKVQRTNGEWWKIDKTGKLWK